MTFNDLIFSAFLIPAIPFLVRHYCASRQFTQQFRIMAIIGGYFWLSLAFGLNDVIIHYLGLYRADDGWHDEMGLEISRLIEIADWSAIRDYATNGNTRFHVWVGAIYFVTGAGKTFGEGLNATLGFWGALALTRHFILAYPSLGAPSYIIGVTLLPTAMFWTSLLIKEALMFWAISIFFVSVIPTSHKGNFQFSTLTVPAFVVGSLMRPYTMVAWVCAIGLVSVYKSGRTILATLMIVGGIVSLSFFSSQLGVESIEDARTLGSDMVTATRGLEVYGVESNIYGSEIFFVSGAVSLFLRPFPWNVRAFRLVISSIEIWTITLSMLYGWWSISPAERSLLLSRADVQVSILVCMAFCILYSYMLNEGQVARSRLQAMPALLTLAYMPVTLKLSQKKPRGKKIFHSSKLR